MYHQIEEKSQDDLTVLRSEIEKQFQYLSKRYNSLFFKELSTSSTVKNKLVITFDDGYRNNLEFLPSLLKKYRLKATIFIPTSFIESGYHDFPMMTFDEIRSLDPEYFEIALHSHAHKNFREITVQEAEEDLRTNMEILSQNQIPYTKVFAYPYGKYPKKNPHKHELFNVLKRLEIFSAVRIGNKVNNFFSKDQYEICRIDVKNSDNLFKFKMKLIFGKLKF